MAEQQFAIAGAAQQELQDLQADLFRRVKFSVMTADEAVEQYFQRVREIISEAKRPVDPDAEVVIQCRFCANRYTVKMDVREFACTCSRDTRQNAIVRRIGIAGERLYEPKRVALTPEGRFL